MSEGDKDVRDPLLSEWMERPELAQVLGVTEDTLQRWQAQRMGPPQVKLGRRVLYRRAAVQEWMRDRETRPVAGKRK